MSEGAAVDLLRLESEVRQRGLSLGFPATYAKQTHSTNDDALQAAAAGAAHGALFLADQQLGGRGRVGRRWLSPPGQNLYVTVLLRPVLDFAKLPTLTLAVGLAVADTAAQWIDSSRVGIKWPNDVHVAGRKLAGILLEATTYGDRVDHVVAGIGLNVLQTEFDPEIAAVATSLAKETGAALDRTEVLVELLDRLHKRLAQFEEGGPESLVEELRKRDVTVGRKVRVGQQMGLSQGIGDDGRLLVQLATGETLLVQAGEVELLPE